MVAEETSGSFYPGEEKELLYVYCICITKPGLQSNNELRNLYSYSCGDYFVVGKNVSSEIHAKEIYQSNLTVLKYPDNQVREHVEIVKLLSEQNSVLPFKYGTVFLTEVFLNEFILENSDSICNNFNLIDGKEEWVVCIYCDQESLKGQIEVLSEAVHALENKIMASPPGKAFLIERMKSELIEDEMIKACTCYSRNYYNKLRKLSVSSQLNKIVAKEITGREETMIMNAAFLVKKINMIDFKNTLDALRNKYGSEGFSIETNGSLPPFSFVQIQGNG